MLTRIHEQRDEHDKSPILSAPATPKVLSTVSYFPLFIKKKEQLPLTYDASSIFFFFFDHPKHRKNAMIASMILARGFVHPTAREKRRGSRAEYSCMALNTICLSHYNESDVKRQRKRKVQVRSETHPRSPSRSSGGPTYLRSTHTAPHPITTVFLN